jgi:calcium permeable stress-gated cation channel
MLTNLFLAICYSHIAPITLGFASVSFFLLYLSYRYNLMYVYDAEIDTRGLLYPRALKQLLVGLYLAEVCMLGLFVLGGTFGSLLLMVLLLIFTILVHISLNDALGPLLYNMPKTLTTEGEASDLPEGSAPSKITTGVLDVEKFGSDSEFDPPDPGETVIHGEPTSRAIEGADGAAHLVTTSLTAMLFSTIKSKIPIDILISYIDFWTYFISPDPTRKPNFFIKWLHPEIFADYTVLQHMLPEDIPDPIYPEELHRNAYFSPSMWKPLFTLWIPRDAGGISRQEVAHTGKVNPVTDEGAWLDAKTNRIVIDLEGKSPVVLERTRY